ncbi:MAG: hypothetical protein H6Q04_2232 [Acidobacteria bacterium]|nr:hypothetical protein [Acidobacteriota bacterium]
MKRLVIVYAVMILLVGMLFTSAAPAEPAARLIQKHISINGISAVQLTWWLQHLADKDGIYWKPLSNANKTIYWVVNPREDAHHTIGSLFESDQTVPKGVFGDTDNLHMQIQFMDYLTQSRSSVAGQTTPLMSALSFPSDYTAMYSSPLGKVTAANNGFNANMIFFDGHGFCPGRILWSWKNTGNDDTVGKVGPPFSIDLYATFYLHWMTGANIPPAMSGEGYYYNAQQIDAIWELWEKTLTKLPGYLPKWFGEDTQDDIARASRNGSADGWTVSAVIDTGVLAGANSKMEFWWWMHGMGDEPGNAYVFWHPAVHHTIRWLPGYSPQEVVGKGKEVPTDRVVPGIIYPDLQGDNLVQSGGGMMAYPVSMSPVPGVYKNIAPMRVVTKAQVDNFASVRFPQPASWLLHQWEDVPGGLVHRSTILSRLPLNSPVSQADFYSEHQLQEGLFKGLGYLPTLYSKWLKTQDNKK